MLGKRLTELLESELPIIQAPMAGAQTSALAIAVCAAGGVGSLPCAMLTPDEARGEIADLHELARGPFNVNFFCHEDPVREAAREAAWLTRLAPYYEELGLELPAPASAPGRRSFDEEMCALVEETRPPIVSFHFGLPDAPLLDRVRATGARILSSATSVAEARWLEDRGVDAVIAQGYEAGGHQGLFLHADVSSQLGTLALLPQIVDAVDIPVIAAAASPTAGASPRRSRSAPPAYRSVRHTSSRRRRRSPRCTARRSTSLASRPLRLRTSSPAVPREASSTASSASSDPSLGTRPRSRLPPRPSCP